MLSLVLHAVMKEASNAVKTHNPRQRFINPFCNDRYRYTTYELQYKRKQILKLYTYIS